MSRGSRIVAGMRRSRLTVVIVIAGALMIALPGIVSAVAFVSSTATNTFTATTTTLAATSCGFYAPENTSAISTINGGTYISFTGGTNGSSITTVSIVTVNGAAYEYLLAEMVVGCVNIPATRTTYVNISVVSATAPNNGGTYAAYSVIYISGGFVGGTGFGMSPCAPVYTACANYPMNPHINPTLKTKCEPTTGGAYGSLYPPYKITTGATADNWDYNITGAAPGWTSNGDCGSTANSGIPTTSVAPAAAIAGPIGVYTVSFGFVKIPAGGFTTAMSVELQVSVVTV